MRRDIKRSGGLALLALVALMGLSACTTTLTASKVGNFDKVVKGQVYYLPRAEFQVNLSRELKSCNVVYQDDAQAALAWLGAQLQSARGADTPEDALKIMDAIVADPVLSRGDVQPGINAVLGSNWLQRVVVTAAAQPPKPGSKQKGKAAKDTREVSDDGLNKLSAAIRQLNLRPELKLEVDVTAQVVPSFAPDASHAYSLDYAPMAEGLKATDYTVETYPGGTLKSVNVTIDDQTGPAILSAIGGITKLTAAASGFPLPTANAAKAVPFQSFGDWQDAQAERAVACKADIRWKLYQRDGLEAQSEAGAETSLALQKDVDKLNDEQVKAIAALEKAQAALKELDENDPKRPEAKAQVTKAESDSKLAAKQVLDAKAKLTGAQQAAAKVVTRLASVRKALTVMSSTTFRPTPAVLSQDLPGAVEALQAWLAPDPCKGDKQCVHPDRSRLAAAMSAQVALYAPSLPGDRSNDVGEVGVFYRQPFKSTLLVCKAQVCTSGGAIVATPDVVLVSSLVDVPQLGALAVLPLKNGPFQNNTITASFAESGALTKLAYKSNAAAAKAAEVFESSADALMKFREAKRNQETSKLEASASELAAKKKLIDAQLALEKAQADLDKFREGKSTSATE
ncbi:hypothetical protein [Roseateles flavus]|uniref:Lipoprotein n=1 Tax=Roseateles flavus TaxID=3149041 RepID=A0ABV0GGE4_9BURK